MFRLWFGGTQNEFTGSNAKTTIAHLPVIRLAKLPIALPPLAEQQKIVARLDVELTAARALVETLETRLAEIELLPATLLRQAFNAEL
jgi:restriction endonuclease S subunit